MPLLHTIYVSLLALTALLLSLFPLYVPWAIALTAVVWLLQKPWQHVKQSRRGAMPVLAALAAFYLWHLAGMIYTENYGAGWFDLEVKASFLVLPLLIGLAPALRQSHCSVIMYTFVAGLLVKGMWGSYTLVDVFGDGEYTKWWYSGKIFAAPLHTGYFAMYLNLAVVFVVFEMVRFYQSRAFWLCMVLFPALIILAGSVLVTTSRTGWAVLLLLMLLFVSYAGWKRWWPLMGGALVLILLAGYSFYHYQDISGFQRWKQLTKLTEKDKTSLSRYQTWHASWLLFQQAPLTGYGTGDVKDKLLQKYQKKGYKRNYEKKLNAHNQFLQTMVALGIPGLLALCSIFFFMFRQAMRTRNLVLFALALISMLFMLTDSLLEVQAGVVFFVFFACILSRLHTGEDITDDPLFTTLYQR